MADRLSGAEATRLARLMALDDEVIETAVAGYTHDGAREWVFTYRQAR